MEKPEWKSRALQKCWGPRRRLYSGVWAELSWAELSWAEQSRAEEEEEEEKEKGEEHLPLKSNNPNLVNPSINQVKPK